MATVSARALIMRLPMERSFAQKGTSPHRTTRSSRAAGPPSAVPGPSPALPAPAASSGASPGSRGFLASTA